MTLTIRILGYKDYPPPEPSLVAFDENGGSLGRDSKNRLVLRDDVEMLISRKHALISFENGCYYLTDTSSNGTMICNKGQLVHKSTAALADGDRLKIGDYELLVHISGSERPEVVYERSLGEYSDTSGFSSRTEDLRTPWDESPAPIPDDFNIGDLIGSGHERRDSGFEADIGLTPGGEIRPKSPVDVYLGAPDVSSPPENAQTSGDEGSATIPEDFNIGDLIGSRDATRGSDSEARKGLKANREIGLLHPLDANLGAPDVTPPAENLQGPEQEGSTAIPDDLTVKILIRESDKSGDREEVVPGLPAVDENLPARSKAPVDVEPRGAVPEVSNAIPVQQGDQGTYSELFNIFLRGAGISDTSFIKTEEIPELMQTIGRVFREMLHGIMTILRGRAESKAQLRLLVTILGTTDNNPLKFIPTVDDALRRLLVRNQPGYLDAYNAVHEGFRDIMNHDLAMKAGVQAALIEALKRFDPEEFEKLYQEGIVMQRKAKCWNAYNQKYRKIFEEVMENFFGQAFIQTYEEQMSKLCTSQTSERDEERGIADG